MVIKKSVLIQYLLITVMFFSTGSSLFNFFLTGNVKYYLIIGAFVLLLLLYKKYRSLYSVTLIMILLFATIITRLLNGGAGIVSFLRLVSGIVTTSMAICCDKKNFLTRWVKLVEFFSFISLCFWVLFLFFPGLVDIWPAQSYVTQTFGFGDWERIVHGKGLLLYSYMEIHSTRNCGIFYEPGVHQVVLTITLFVLLFWKNKLSFNKESDYKRSLIIIIAALISSQSTTGYISLALILLFFYIFERGKTKSNIRTIIVTVTIIIVMGLFVDNAIRGNESILYSQIIKKLFSSQSGSFDFSDGTGQYRWGTIIVSLDVISKNPFGIGADALAVQKLAYGDGLVAASFFAFAAVYGIIPWLAVLAMLFTPLFLYERKWIAVLYVFLFINTTLGQSELIYAAFFMIPMFLVVTRNIKERSINEKHADYIQG